MRRFFYKYGSLLLMLGFLLLWGEMQGQGASKPRKNQFEHYLNVCHFFDGSQTNWGLFVDVIDFSGKTVDRGMPATIGLQYTRMLNEDHSLRVAAHIYGIVYQKLYSDFAIGEVMQRIYSMYSLGYMHRLLSYSNKLHLQAIADINFRRGDEMVYLGYSLMGGHQVSNIVYRDWGISIGTRLQYDLILGIVMSFEVRYSRLLYLHDEHLPYYGYAGGTASPNILTLQLGAGYRF